MNTVNTIATDTAVKGVNKQPIADGIGLGKTNPEPDAASARTRPAHGVPMKLHHKINHGWQRPSDPISDAYQREIDETLRKAEKAYRKAQRDAERAERRAAQRPDPETLAARDEARRLVLQRLDELRQIEELMRTPTHAPPKVVHRSGREERLEVGTYKRRKTPKNRKTAVKTRRKP